MREYYGIMFLLLLLAFNAIIHALVIYNSRRLYWLSFSVLLISDGDWKTLLFPQRSCSVPPYGADFIYTRYKKS